MCRNITELRGLEPPATTEEIEAAARQYVRKVSGFTRPSAANAEAFEAAVAEVAATTTRLLHALPERRQPPKNDPPWPRPARRGRGRVSRSLVDEHRARGPVADSAQRRGLGGRGESHDIGQLG